MTIWYPKWFWPLHNIWGQDGISSLPPLVHMWRSSCEVMIMIILLSWSSIYVYANPIWWSFNIYIMVWSHYPDHQDMWVLMECLSPSSPAAWPTFAPNMTFATQLLLKKRQKKRKLWRSIVSIELELECTCTEIFSTQNRFGSLVFQWKDLFPTEFVIFRILISRSKAEFLAFSVI